MIDWLEWSLNAGLTIAHCDVFAKRQFLKSFLCLKGQSKPTLRRDSMALNQSGLLQPHNFEWSPSSLNAFFLPTGRHYRAQRGRQTLSSCFWTVAGPVIPFCHKPHKECAAATLARRMERLLNDLDLSRISIWERAHRKRLQKRGGELGRWFGELSVYRIQADQSEFSLPI